MKYAPHILTALVVFILASAFTAQPGKWELLGSRMVNWAVDHDEIMVTAARGDFRKIQVKVFKAPVHFRDMKVHYRNGDVQDVDLRERIPAGGMSRVIDLNGKERIITRISFRYDTAKPAPRGRAVVKVFGMN